MTNADHAVPATVDSSAAEPSLQKSCDLSVARLCEMACAALREGTDRKRAFALRCAVGAFVPQSAETYREALRHVAAAGWPIDVEAEVRAVWGADTTASWLLRSALGALPRAGSPVAIDAVAVCIGMARPRVGMSTDAALSIAREALSALAGTERVYEWPEGWSRGVPEGWKWEERDTPTRHVLAGHDDYLVEIWPRDEGGFRWHVYMPGELGPTLGSALANDLPPAKRAAVRECWARNLFGEGEPVREDPQAGSPTGEERAHRIRAALVHYLSGEGRSSGETILREHLAAIGLSADIPELRAALISIGAFAPPDYPGRWRLSDGSPWGWGWRGTNARRHLMPADSCDVADSIAILDVDNGGHRCFWRVRAPGRAGAEITSGEAPSLDDAQAAALHACRLHGVFAQSDTR